MIDPPVYISWIEGEKEGTLTLQHQTEMRPGWVPRRPSPAISRRRLLRARRPPRFDSTQLQDLDEDPQEHPQEDPQGEPLSIYANKEDYSKPYFPRIDYLEPSIVPSDMHNRMDLNYTSWAIRHAIMTNIQPLKAEQETVLKKVRDLTHFVKSIGHNITFLIDQNTKQDKAIDLV
ncbi:hypothetical protein DFP73DRAFT_529763 [Morchella snyderi]|nr:hypothetical protein DFP73DRAFT_529763 [Morchella snyderi]